MTPVLTAAQQLRRDIEACELPHPMFEELRITLKRFIDDTLAGFESKIIRVPGPSGAGKSSLINNLARDYPEYRVDGRRHVPVLVVKLRSGVSAKTLPKSVLDALGIPVVRRSQTAGDLGAMMVDQLKKAGTLVVIFDEASHLVDEGARVSTRAASEWFKTLFDDLGGMLILFGIPRLERLFSANEQLRRRSIPARKFLHYAANHAKEMAAFHACVANYGRLFAAAGYPIDVPARALTQQCYLLTGGLVGVLADFMKALASLMADEAPRAITYADCQAALEYVDHAGSPHQLPFQDSGIEDAGVAPAALQQAYVHVLNSNAMSVPVRKKSGDKQ
ncbi:adenylate kinase family enzyme [Paraburkholderia youngii]|uniref:TniB family NTP-binding protein n=1 Tax=Paraburkholderia youngii TaxID=2782701 RepID=UPI003D220AA3